MANFSILLAASAEKKPGGNPFAPDMFDYRSSNTFNYFHELNPDRRALIRALQSAVETSKKPETLLGLKGDALQAAIDVDLEIFNAPLISALERYSPGVLFSAMNFQGLPTGAQRRLLENGVIFSPVFGVLRPDDLIPDYQLGFSTKIPKLGTVAAFWKKHMSDLLNERIANRVVWNVLPEECEKAWRDDHSYERMYKVGFAVDSGGKRSFLEEGPLAGQFINFVVREAAEDLELARQWVHSEGYKFDADAEHFDEKTRVHTIVYAKRA